jgi:hypothetical protein
MLGPPLDAESFRSVADGISFRRAESSGPQFGTCYLSNLDISMLDNYLQHSKVR